MTYSVHDAKTHFSKLLDLVEEGEDVIIKRRGRILVKLVAMPVSDKPVLGSMKGEIAYTEGWERAMTDQEAEDFLEGKG
jgi:prevent-host-death family protein